MKRLVLAALLTIAGAAVLAPHASAGSVLTGISPTTSTFLSTTMGLRFVTASSSLQGAPKTYKAQVVDADRFAARGFARAKVNDAVTITVIDDKRGNVRHEKSGKAIVFHLTSDGKVERD